MKRIVIGTLAHVDAGKTTLSESMLYTAGSIRRIGRVDHQDTFLDYDTQERQRGITIYAKQAMLTWQDCELTLIDTPGHVDFSAEMERTLQILDYAIVVISALDGVQVHSETIWRLLAHYQIPTFVFVNKMDIAHDDKATLMQMLEKQLSVNCVDFTLPKEERDERISLCDDALLEVYENSQQFSDTTIKEAISKRQIFPCFFGSALKQVGVEAFLQALHTYTKEATYPDKFGARVYKVTHDEQGNRFTHVRLLGGHLKVKQKLNEQEKVDQIRLYSGTKYKVVNEVEAGQVCALKGVQSIMSGEGLGIVQDMQAMMLTAYMMYTLVLPEQGDIQLMWKQMQQLAQEDPQLCVHYEPTHKVIQVQLMGEIQIEVLKNTIQERFGVQVEFDQGSVVYKETIKKSVEGVGHFEPLRHYAEVHLLLEPLPRNEGLQFKSDCSEDVLARQWQRAILQHLQEKEHVGVLTRSPITDMRITLLAGKAHLKHTEGGDFREATYRAVRQGLMESESILLEPYFQFRLEIGATYLSRAMYDLEQMDATFTLPSTTSEQVVIRGSAPVRKMQHYQQTVIAYTKGSGRLYCSLLGYQECQNAQAIISSIAYDSERDAEHVSGSVFCTHGSGFYVPWYEVKKHMHIKACYVEKTMEKQQGHQRVTIHDQELERVMKHTYGSFDTKIRVQKTHLSEAKVSLPKHQKTCLLVDGYNIIHAWDELKELAHDHMDAARNRLIDRMSSYQGFKRYKVIVVFDGYLVKDGIGSTYHNGSIDIIYTKKGQTADQYIEKSIASLVKEYRVLVATSDGLEQVLVSGQGAYVISASELYKELQYSQQQSMERYEEKQSKVGHRLLEGLREYNEE